VEELRLPAQVEAVEPALAAFRLQPHVDVRAGEGGAEGEREGGEPAAAPLAGLDAGDVEGAIALHLPLVVLDDRPLAESDLGDGVREVGLTRGTGVGLHDAGLAVGPRLDEDAGMRERGRAPG